MRSENNIKLQKIKNEDLELIMAWRSNPLIYKHFHMQDSPLTWKEHITFWNAKDKKGWIILFKEDNKWRKVGIVTTSHLSDIYPMIGIYIGEITLWGKDLGKKAVKIVLEWLYRKGYIGAIAMVSKENERSQRLFENLGFIRKKGIGKRWLYEKGDEK